MSEDHGGQPVIVRPKKKGEHAAHGGAWKVAYADFVTAMMAFFIVMWVMGMSQETRDAIAGYFQDPRGFSSGGSGGSASASLLDSKGGESILTQTQEEHFKLLESEIMQQIERTPELEQLKDSISMQVTEEGLRIELIESDKAPFFEVGSDEMKPATVTLLGLIAQTLAQGDDHIAIEGHTDSRPFTGEGERKGYSNWELSADRANAARRVMEPLIKGDQLQAIRGLADRELRYPDDPMNPGNRRVSILVRPAGSPPEDAADPEVDVEHGASDANGDATPAADAAPATPQPEGSIH
jgi:chemotaxis protein MotB